MRYRKRQYAWRARRFQQAVEEKRAAQPAFCAGTLPRARVAYCEPLGVNSFAVGLQLLAATGNWN
jgi:hypothetical protein